jgi:hypothetical protein
VVTGLAVANERTLHDWQIVDSEILAGGQVGHSGKGGSVPIVRPEAVIGDRLSNCLAAAAAGLPPHAVDRDGERNVPNRQPAMKTRARSLGRRASLARA